MEIGFWAEDTPLGYQHVGTPLTVDLNLGIKSKYCMHAAIL